MADGRQRLHAAVLAGGILAAALAGGCQPSSPAPEPRRANVQLDACGERLHDLCGSLLRYYAAHKRLPQTLEELAGAASVPAASLVCPLSGKPYVYDPAGLPLPNRQGRLVLVDPEPSHAGMRWGILTGAAAGGLITANAILVSEEEFNSASQQPPPPAPAGP